MEAKEIKPEPKDDSTKVEEVAADLPQTEQRKMKREDFRKYLEYHGITEILTKVLSNLYLEPEIPRDPMDYIKAFLDRAHRPEGSIAQVRFELAETTKELDITRRKMQYFKDRLSKYETIEEDKIEISVTINNNETFKVREFIPRKRETETMKQEPETKKSEPEAKKSEPETKDKEPETKKTEPKTEDAEQSS